MTHSFWVLFVLHKAILSLLVLYKYKQYVRIFDTRCGRGKGKYARGQLVGRQMEPDLLVKLDQGMII